MWFLGYALFGSENGFRRSKASWIRKDPRKVPVLAYVDGQRCSIVGLSGLGSLKICEITSRKNYEIPVSKIMKPDKEGVYHSCYDIRNSP